MIFLVKITKLIQLIWNFFIRDKSNEEQCKISLRIVSYVFDPKHLRQKPTSQITTNYLDFSFNVIDW